VGHNLPVPIEIVVPDEFKYLYETNAERPIVKIPHPVLRQTATDVSEVSAKINKLIDDMIRKMQMANGVGLAAPQVGVGKRVIIISPEGMRPTPLINPVIVESSGSVIGQEGCLSIPGLYGDVERPQRIVVEAYDRKGKAIAFEMEGMPARIVLHEVDHLDGKLFIDTVIEETLHWSHPSGSHPDDI
jgi:peptide deformylase